MSKIKRPNPKENEIYKHFKGSLYQIVAIAVHTENSEKMVVYRSIEKPERVFARPLEMFMSEVDRIRYPLVRAKYRFTLMVEAEEVIEPEQEEIEQKQEEIEPEQEEIEPEQEEIGTEQKENEPEQEEIESNQDEELSEEDSELASDIEEISVDKTDEEYDTAVYNADGELVLDPIVEAVLDEKEFSDKIENFERLRNKCTNEMLTTIAISLDIQLEGESVEENYAQILKTLRMHNKYESARLRS